MNLVIHVPRVELLAALDATLPGVTTKADLFEGMDVFAFEGKAVKTYNQDIAVAYPLETGLLCAVRAKEFYKIILKMTTDTLDLSVDDNKLVVKGGKTKVKMTLQPEDILGKVMKGTQAETIMEWMPIPEDFFKALKLCAFSIGNDPTWGALNYLKVTSDGVMLSTNAYRASMYELGTPMPEFHLKRSAVNEAMKLTNVSEYTLENGWLHFKQTNGAIFSVAVGSLNKDQWPTERIISNFMSDRTGPYQFPTGLYEVVDRAAVFAEEDGKQKYVDLKVVGDALQISGTVVGKRQSGSIEDEVPLNGASFPTFSVPPHYLTHMIQMSSTFYMLKDESYLLIELGKFKHLMARRVKATKGYASVQSTQG